MRRGRFDSLAWLLTPALFAVPVAAGVAIFTVRLLGTPWPDLHWAVAISTDAGSFLNGGSPFGRAYTGQLYTPLYPLLVSGLDRLGYWEGWPLLLAVLAGTASAALVAWIGWPAVTAAQPRPSRALRLLCAAGLGALAWSFNYSLLTGALYQGRADQLAWAFSLYGLVLWPVALRGSRPAALGAVALLSAAFWTKQSTVVVAVAAGLWAALEVARGRRELRAALPVVAALVLVNGAILGLVNLATDGREWWLNFTLAGDYAHPFGVGFLLGELGDHLGLAAVTAAALGLLALVAPRARASPADEVRDDAAVLFLFCLPFAIASAIWFHRLVGSEDNQDVGVAWLLGLLAAAAYRRCGSARATRLGAAALIAVVGVTTLALPRTSYWSLRHRRVVPAPAIRVVADDARRFARANDVYSSVYSDLGVPSGRFPRQHYQAIQNLLWGGRQPRALVRDLLGRKIAVVYPFPEALDSSGAGKWESGYFWKLNQVLRAKYRVDPRTPRLDSGFPAFSPGMRPVPGPDPAPWLKRCFGPFRLGGAMFRIRTGGGLWCTVPGAPGTIEMRGTRARFTELESADPVARMRGLLAIRLPALGGGFELHMGPWSVRGQRVARPAGILVSTDLGSRLVPAARLRRAGGVLTLAIGTPAPRAAAATVPVPTPDAPGNPLEIWTSAGSGARFDLARLVFT